MFVFRSCIRRLACPSETFPPVQKPSVHRSMPTSINSRPFLKQFRMRPEAIQHGHKYLIEDFIHLTPVRFNVTFPVP